MTTRRAFLVPVALALLVGALPLALAQPTPPAQGAELVVVARLAAPPREAPHCGILHVAVVMRYEVVRVLSGRYRERTLYAAHGCPQMPRRVYNGPSAGTLTAFRAGDLHRLELRRAPPAGVGGPSYLDDLGDRHLPRYWTLRADPAP